MIDYSEGMMEKMENSHSDHFFPLAQPTLLEVLVGKQQMGSFNNVEMPYTGVEKRKPLMRSVKKTDSSDLGNQLEIAAYYLWQSRGCPFDDPEADWREAERQYGLSAKSA